MDKQKPDGVKLNSVRLESGDVRCSLTGSVWPLQVCSVRLTLFWDGVWWSQLYNRKKLFQPLTSHVTAKLSSGRRCMLNTFVCVFSLDSDSCSEVSEQKCSNVTWWYSDDFMSLKSFITPICVLKMKHHNSAASRCPSNDAQRMSVKETCPAVTSMFSDIISVRRNSRLKHLHDWLRCLNVQHNPSYLRGISSYTVLFAENILRIQTRLHIFEMLIKCLRSESETDRQNAGVSSVFCRIHFIWTVISKLFTESYFAHKSFVLKSLFLLFYA